jgi:hypothetical protein
VNPVAWGAACVGEGPLAFGGALAGGGASPTGGALACGGTPATAKGIVRVNQRWQNNGVSVRKCLENRALLEHVTKPAIECADADCSERGENELGCIANDSSHAILMSES